MSVETPCIRLCRLDPSSSLCLGCGRHLDEIAAWASLSGERRREIQRALPARLSAIAAGG